VDVFHNKDRTICGIKVVKKGGMENNSELKQYLEWD